MKTAAGLKKILTGLADTADIATLREQFALLSEQTELLLGHFGVPEGKLYRAFCPMAFDNRGARWLQDTEELSNPYFGAAMLRCGVIEEVLE